MSIIQDGSLKIGAKLFIGILIFWILAWKSGFSEIIHNLAGMKLSVFGLISLTTLNGIFTQAVCVILLGKTINPAMEWCSPLKGFLRSISLAIFIPGRAGDFALPFYWKEFMQYGECLSVILIDKFNTLCWVFIMGSCGLYLIFDGFIGLAAGCIGFFLLAFFICILSIRRFRLIVSNCLPQKGMNFLKGSMNAFRMILNENKPTLIGTFFLSGYKIVLAGVGLWISLWGLSISCPLFYSICLMSIAQFIALIPISIMGLGTVEAVCIYGLAQIGIDSGQVIAALLVGRIVSLFWLSLFFTIFNLNKSFKIKRPRPQQCSIKMKRSQ